MFPFQASAFEAFFLGMMIMVQILMGGESSSRARVPGVGPGSLKVKNVDIDVE
jgi:hypothetical protein